MNLGGSVKINKCGIFILLIICFIAFYYLIINGGVNGDNNSSSRKDQYGFSKNPNEINLRKLLIGSIQAAQKGGFEVLTVSHNVDIHAKSKGKTFEGANDPITDADLKSHCVMQQGLHRIFPKLKIISEEDTAKKKCPDVNLFDLDPTVLYDTAIVPDENVNINDVTVWIDPLDATQEYTGNNYRIIKIYMYIIILFYS